MRIGAVSPSPFLCLSSRPACSASRPLAPPGPSLSTHARLPHADQAGVFISRSSGMLWQATRAVLWAMPTMQVGAARVARLHVGSVLREEGLASAASADHRSPASQLRPQVGWLAFFLCVASRHFWYGWWLLAPCFVTGARRGRRCPSGVLQLLRRDAGGCPVAASCTPPPHLCRVASPLHCPCRPAWGRGVRASLHAD